MTNILPDVTSSLNHTASIFKQVCSQDYNIFNVHSILGNVLALPGQNIPKNRVNNQDIMTKLQCKCKQMCRQTDKWKTWWNNKQECQVGPVSLTLVPDKFPTNWLFSSGEPSWQPSWISDGNNFSNFYTPPHDSGEVLWYFFFVVHVSVHPLYIRPPVFSFLDNNLSKCQWTFTKLGKCTDIVDIWFEITNGQILSSFDSYMPTTCPYFHFRMIT